MTTYRISCDFPRAWLPAWQDGLQVTLTSGGNQALTMRGVPDASGDADPETGYDVRIDGTDTVIGGTSAVAPLWAGLIARINRTNRHSICRTCQIRWSTKRPDRWSLGVWPTSSPASATSRFTASGLDLARTPRARH